MTDRITAQEAYSIATEGHKKLMDKRVCDTLTNIYDSVHQAAQNGMMWVKVPINIWGEEYRNKLNDPLKQDGFKYSYEALSDGDNITISWNQPK